MGLYIPEGQDPNLYNHLTSVRVIGLTIISLDNLIYMRMWFEVNQHKERSIRTFNEKGSEVKIIICQVISITARLIVPFNNIQGGKRKIMKGLFCNSENYINRGFSPIFGKYF